MRLILIIVLLATASIALTVPSSDAANKTFSVTVDAGAVDRRDSIVIFDLPTAASAKSYRLRDESGTLIPLQIDSDRRASFILKSLTAGKLRSYRLEAAAPITAGTGVSVSRDADQLKVSLVGAEVLRYRLGKGELPRPDIKPIFRRGGYIHPVITPAGRVITDDYPTDHLHHHGIWFPWTKTEFEGRQPDFWNMGDGTGSVEFVALDETWSGSVHGGFRTRHRFVDLSAPSPKVALNETWVVHIYNVGTEGKPYHLFDLFSTQEAAGPNPLILPEYHYGGMGFRGHAQWNGKDNSFFLTSEGKDRSNGHATRARWCHIGGRVDGHLAGIAILGHPKNFRAPQPMRIHPTEPFFCFAPSQLGRWGISPGHPYVSHYRYVVTDGPPDKREIEERWNDYANPPRVTVAEK